MSEEKLNVIVKAIYQILNTSIRYIVDVDKPDYYDYYYININT